VRPARRLDPIRSIVASYIEDVGSLSYAHARALRAAVPRDQPLHTSHWFDEGAARARRATNLPIREALDIIDGFLRWCHRRYLVPTEHVAIQLAQLELLRRRHGAPHELMKLPEVGPDSHITREHCAQIVAQWEGMSYVVALTATCRDDELAMLIDASAFQLVTHLAEHDGVPLRLERLDPAALAIALAEQSSDADYFATTILNGVAVLYQRFAERGWVAPRVAADLALQLRGLARAAERLEPTKAAAPLN
jgi:hypothetical protein